jgi:hypothetical protein
MTAVEVCYKYGLQPTEIVMRSLDNVREVYGIRRIKFNEVEKTVRVEYDATRLNEDSVASLLKGSGLDLREKLALV